MDVFIRIKGTQTVDGHDDVVEMATVGTLERLPDGWQLCYPETEATGMEGSSTCLHVQPDRVHLQRSGPHPSMLVLEKNRRHHCNYNTPYGTIDLGTYTSAMECNLSEKGGTLRFAYTLGFNGGISSAHTVDITVQEDSHYVKNS